MRRDHLTDLIDRNSQAILDESRRFAPALDRRSYTTMSPDAAADAYAADLGQDELTGEEIDRELNESYEYWRRRVLAEGVGCLAQWDRDLVLNQSDACISICNDIVSAVMSGRDTAALRDQYAAAIAQAITDKRAKEWY